MSVATVVFWAAIVAMGYVFIGYPLLLFILGSVVRRKPVPPATTWPTVSLIISAYNEEKIIGEKLENCLSLDYPKDKLEIIVVSDASTDSTDMIVERYACEGVGLKRMPTRGGKTTGLNAVVPLARGDIVVFSDANALYATEAIRRLVRNFADPSVGCVTGDSRYVQLDTSYVGNSENTYWDYERGVKMRESVLGSMVGADGAIFAIRRHLYRPLQAADINDFVIPLQIVSQGYRCVFEPEAVCYESAVVHFEEEFRRKVRVANRSWNGLFRVKELLNPLRYGWFTIQLISHKPLRWLTPLFLGALLVCSLLLAPTHWFYAGLAIGQVSVYALGGLGTLLEKWHIHNRWLSFPCYFLLMNVASIVGICKYLRGEKINIWEPERQGQYRQNARRATPLRWAALLAGGGGLLAVILGAPKFAFWITGGLVVYTYLGYPMLCLVLSRFLYKPWHRGNATPSVTLLVVAHNEEDVISRKLDNCQALDYPSHKLTIVVASDGSTDGTNAILRQYARDGVVVHCYPQRAGKMAAINRIIPTLQTDLVVLSDANVMYASDALRKLVRNFADDSVGAVSGKVTLVSNQPIPGLPERLYYRYEWIIQRLESRIGSLIGVDGAMYGMRRVLFQAVPDHVVLDDFVISMNIAKQGKRVVYEPEARGYEASAISFSIELRRRSRLVAGAIQSLLRGEGCPRLTQPLLLFKYVSHKVLRWVTPVFLLTMFMANLLLLDTALYVIALGAQLAFYAAALLGKLQRSPAWMFAIPLYFCGVNVAAACGVVRGILNRQPGAWERFKRVSDTDNIMPPRLATETSRQKVTSLDHQP
jgi:cellulose synthase/poly-beta-1,6-N-acetylglucosamine synthase-like glycosyltransferase